MAETRRVSAEVIINSKNISDDIAPFLKSITINDELEGESNTAELELEDRERLWIKDWFPQRGDSCSLSLIRKNWTGDGKVESLDFGVFEIDEITNSFPPNVCKIKLNSVSQNAELRSVEKSRSWENVQLSKICSDIATDAALELFFDAKDNPTISRAEQKTESNLTFLVKLCRDKGLAVRVADGKLIVFEEEKLEQQDAVFVLEYGDDKVKSFSGTATISQIYTAAEVNYTHGPQKQTISGSFSDPTKNGGMTLRINKKVNSQAEADELAKKELRDKNKKEIQVRMDLTGNFDCLSGNVIGLGESFGFYAGNYLIERSNFKIGSGFTVSLELRKCLSGY